MDIKSHITCVMEENKKIPAIRSLFGSLEIIIEIIKETVTFIDPSVFHDL